MYKGLKAREGHSFSLTSPSRFYLQARKRIRFDALQAIVPSICQAVVPCISVCLQVS